MGRNSMRRAEKSGPSRNTVNPYMRGIGCILMVVVPLFAFGLGDILAGQRVGYGILPPEWYGVMIFPPQVYQLSGLSAVAVFLATKNHLQATLFFTIIAIVVIGGVISVVFGYMHTLFAPSQWGPTDMPPVRVKTKKYKR